MLNETRIWARYHNLRNGLNYLERGGSSYPVETGEQPSPMFEISTEQDPRLRVLLNLIDAVAALYDAVCMTTQIVPDVAAKNRDLETAAARLNEVLNLLPKAVAASRPPTLPAALIRVRRPAKR